MGTKVIYVHGWDWWPPKALGRRRTTAPPLPKSLKSAERWHDADFALHWWNSEAWFPYSVKRTVPAASDLRKKIRTLLSAGPEIPIDVIGFSLGARVVHEALRGLHETELCGLRDVFLFGGALPSFVSWWKIAQGVRGGVANFSSRHDTHLSLGYQTQLGPRRKARAIGFPSYSGPNRLGIHTRLMNVRNFDASDVVEAHGKHQTHMGILVNLHDSSATILGTSPAAWRDEFDLSDLGAPPTGRTVRELRGARAEIIQRALLAQPALGFPVTSNDVSGVVGSRTRKAIASFQETRGLRPDGCVGPLTWAQLLEA